MFPWCSSVSLFNDVVSLKKNQGNLPKYLIRVEKQLCEKSQMGPQFQPHPRKPSYCPSRESSLGIVPEHHNGICEYDIGMAHLHQVDGETNVRVIDKN